MENPSPHSSHIHLPTTPSYLTPHSYPQTPSLLSRSNSRTSVSKSSLTLTSLTPNPRRPDSKISGTKTPTTTIPSTDSTSWLIQTASVLSLQTQESKGQSWLATRTSSTSLLPIDPTALSADYEEADDEYSPITSRSHPSSRYGSRSNSRRASRADLGMTSAVLLRRGDLVEGLEETFEFRDGPDFIDEEEDEEVGDEEGDVDVDEGEMERLVWGRVGGWVDWAVGWMDFRRDEEGDEEEQEKSGDADEEGQNRNGKGTRRKQQGGKSEGKKSKEGEGRQHVPTKELADEIPPIHGEGGWDDAKWLLNVATKLVW